MLHKIYWWPEHSWHLALLIMATGLLLSSSRHRANIISVAASVVISLNLVAALIYLVLPQYVDHAEASVVIMALNAHNGLPLYPDWSLGEGAYGMLYGPLLSAAVGIPLFARHRCFPLHSRPTFCPAAKRSMFV